MRSRLPKSEQRVLVIVKGCYSRHDVDVDSVDQRCSKLRSICGALLDVRDKNLRDPVVLSFRHLKHAGHYLAVPLEKPVALACIARGPSHQLAVEAGGAIEVPCAKHAC